MINLGCYCWICVFPLINILKYGQNSFSSSKRYTVNEIPSDFYGFGSSFPAFITVGPGFCNSLLVALLTRLMQSLCLAQKAAVKWNLVPGDTNISLTLTLLPSFGH